uniref:hypothetical protein n=1 Tax=Gloeochaete wittrockiana TaxID=38269 RepID=UPI00051A97DA|nr:hypothetical protein [Gloeochaete wittrockiana]
MGLFKIKQIISIIVLLFLVNFILKMQCNIILCIILYKINKRHSSFDNFLQSSARSHN